jgi:hypothetical protein
MKYIIEESQRYCLSKAKAHHVYRCSYMKVTVVRKQEEQKIKCVSALKGSFITFFELRSLEKIALIFAMTINYNLGF